MNWWKVTGVFGGSVFLGGAIGSVFLSGCSTDAQASEPGGERASDVAERPEAPSGTATTLFSADFVIDSQADLDAVAPPVGDVHTFSNPGAYEFGSFTLTSQRRIVVPTGVAAELRGRSSNTELVGTVDNAAVFQFDSGSTVHLHDLVVTNNSIVATPRAIETAGASFLHDARFASASGEGVRVTGGRFFGTQVRAINTGTGVAARGGETFLEGFDAETLTYAISINAATTGVSWIGGRVNGYTNGIRVNANCTNILVQGVTAMNGSAFVKRDAGSVSRATVSGNNVSGTTTAVSWASASIPSAALLVVGNQFGMTTPFSGFTHTSARVNSKGNAHATGLMSETPIVP